MSSPNLELIWGNRDTKDPPPWPPQQTPDEHPNGAPDGTPDGVSDGHLRDYNDPLI